MTCPDTARDGGPRQESTTADFDRREPALKDVGIISVCLAGLGILVNGLIALGFASSMPEIADHAAQTRQAFLMRNADMARLPEVLAGYHAEYLYASVEAFVFAVFLLLAILLLLGGISLMKWRPRGIRFHWWYALIKLPVCLLAGTNVLSTWSGIPQMLDSAPFNWLILSGCAYPTALLVFLTRRRLRARAPHEPQFAAGDARTPTKTAISSRFFRTRRYNRSSDIKQRPARFGFVGDASIIVGFLCAAFCLVLIWAMTPAVTKAIAAVFMGLSLLLISGGVLLLRSDRRGIVVLKLYACLQILACLVFSIALMRDIYNGPAGFVFYLGAIPGIVGSIYPLLLFVFLRRRAIQSEKMNPMRFVYIVEKAADGTYSAYVPDLPGCTTSGNTAEQVRIGIKQALDSYLDSLCEHNEPIPVPNSLLGTVEAG